MPRTVKMDKIEYGVDTNTIVGVKTLRFDFYMTDNSGILTPSVRVSILSSNISEFGERYALLSGSRIYLFISALERATFFKNFIYSMPFPEDFKGKVKLLMVRMDKKGDSERPTGVISMNFFEPLKTQKIKEDDRKSAFFYMLPLDMLGLSYRMREILTAMRTITYAVKYGKSIVTE